MQTETSPKAGERTQRSSTIDPVYDFLTSLRDCTFHFGLDQHELTIKAPDGGKIGLLFVDEIKTLTASRAERNARMVATELYDALKYLARYPQALVTNEGFRVEVVALIKKAEGVGQRR